LQARLGEIQQRIEALRTEQRRRQRQAELAARQATRAVIEDGMPSLEDVISGAAGTFASELEFGALRFLRESATEVGLGYASASKPTLSFTDGRAIREVSDLGEARRLWAEGWEPGTPAARGVRVYPVGSRAEKVLPASEVHVQLR
jgi:hypothetical protein